ncbi:hypothetical protein H5410_028187 [Solanum commersonii]|uniref:Serine hydroxymethyltransferase-like domain-containing protein n=1 Tax=Solanum commersonii TaxID=4109 RepID=A0A9J5Z485_SOLCO|nr:hypothetical protein H5410_028187 [Solanum commersonii]
MNQVQSDVDTRVTKVVIGLTRAIGPRTSNKTRLIWDSGWEWEWFHQKGGNPTGWIVRAEQYFTYLGFFEKEWLPITHFYLDGAAYDWFQWLYRNNQFFDWKHFTDKLALHFVNDFNEINDIVNALDLMQKLDDNFSYIPCKLDNVQHALSTYSQSVIADPVPPDVDSYYDDNGDLALSFADSSPIFKDLVAFDTDTEVTGGTLEEVSRISTYKVFVEIPDRDIDMEVANSIKNDAVKLETQVFDESDQYTLDQFPYDPGANVFILTSGGSLQVHQLHPATFVFNLLLVMDTFQLFESVSYIHPTVKLAKPLIDNESIISIRDPGISSKFWAITGSRDRVELSNWEQLGGVEMGVETFNAMYFDRCLWVTEHIGDHLDYSCMEYKCGILVKEFHTCDDKVEISEFIVSAKFLCRILEYQLRVVRRQNKWMSLSSPYVVCNILTKVLYGLSPNDGFECYMTLQPVSYSLPGFVLFVTFANRPFDPGTRDIPLSYVANENMFRNSSFVSTYVLVVTLWGEQVCRLKRKHVGTTASEQFINLLELLLALNLVGLDASTGYSDCKQLEICDTLFRTKLIATNASASTRQHYYARLCKVCSKQKVSLLANMAHISGVVSSLVICSTFKYSTFVTFATQFMGAKVYTTIVFGKRLFALSGFGNEKTIFYIIPGWRLLQEV